MNMEIKKIDKASISFRIGFYRWFSGTRFDELLDLLDKYSGVVDEVTFFTSHIHSPLPLDTTRKLASILSERMDLVREKGLRSGIDILALLGHLEEGLPYSLSGDYTYMTDIDGNVCRGSLCPNDEAVCGYIRKSLEAFTMSDPDYIWFDDDVRLNNHLPVPYACFCDNCLAIFEREYGLGYSRKALKCAFNSGTINKKLELRKSWLQHNRNTFSRLMELIETTVHAIRPDMPIGAMTGDRFFEGYDFDKWVELLAGPGNSDVMWRPGGGYYSDDSMSGLAHKSHEVGRQVSLLQDNVVIIQSEMENFPYQPLAKSAKAVLLEVASHIAAGCTGSAYDIFSFYDDPIEEYLPFVAKLKDMRSFYDLMVRNIGRFKPVGIYTGWGKDTYAVHKINDTNIINKINGENWVDVTYNRVSGNGCNISLDKIFEIGLPVSYSAAYAPVTALYGDVVLALNNDEIIKILSTGVYMDAWTLDHLNKLGYNELTGFRVENFLDVDCIEKFTDHPLNGCFAGRVRDNRQSFLWEPPEAVLNLSDEKAEILSKMVDYSEKEIAECCMGIFENRLGGRICVAGYGPWNFIQNMSKSSQVKSVMRWLSKDKLPAYIASLHKINMWAREPEKGRLVIAVTNSCLDTVRDVVIMILTENKEIRVIDMKCSETHILSCGTDGPYRKFILPAIEAWEIQLIITDSRRNHCSSRI